MKQLLFFLSFVLLTGCGSAFNQSKPADKPADKFSLVASTDGKVYRLDKQTGEIALVSPDGIKIIGSSKDPLGILK
jgi:hypothetical protein